MMATTTSSSTSVKPRAGLLLQWGRLLRMVFIQNPFHVS